MYLQQRTRPDISIAISKMSSGHVEPIHWKWLKQVENYVTNTKDLCLVFKRCETPIEIICSVDASFATGPKKKSITGWSIYVGGSLVYWRTKTQPVTAQSSAEAELIAITDVVKNGLWLKRLLQIVQPKCNTKIVILGLLY